MSSTGQRPEHLLIREYVTCLVEKGHVTKAKITEHFVEMYCELVPPGEDVPAMKPVHRHDTVAQKEHKEDANLKKLFRAINGPTYFPICFKEPLLHALELVKPGAGMQLRKILLRNAGLLHMPINNLTNANFIYSGMLKEFSEANAKLVDDLADDGLLNNEDSRNELLDSIEMHLAALLEIDKNTNK